MSYKYEEWRKKADKEEVVRRKIETPNSVDLDTIEGYDMRFYRMFITAALLPQREGYKDPSALISIKKVNKNEDMPIPKEYIRLSVERLEGLIKNLITLSITLRRLRGETEDDIRDAFDYTISEGVNKAPEYYSKVKGILNDKSAKSLYDYYSKP